MLAEIPELLLSFQKGEMIILIQESPGPRGFLVCAAEKTTPSVINQMITYGKGIVCVAMTRKRVSELNLPLMINQNSQKGTMFTVSVDGKETKTGISAYERAMTVQALLDTKSTKNDFRMPGHIFPLIGRDLGVLEREHYVEASLDLALLSGLQPMAVFVEILDDNGQTATMEYLQKLAKKLKINVTSIAKIKDFRIRKENFAVRTGNRRVTLHGRQYALWQYKHKYKEKYYLVICPPTLAPSIENAVVVQECVANDLFGDSRNCRCPVHLRDALKKIHNRHHFIIYERDLTWATADSENHDAGSEDRMFVIAGIIRDLEKFYEELPDSVNRNEIQESITGVDKT